MGLSAKALLAVSATILAAFISIKWLTGSECAVVVTATVQPVPNALGNGQAFSVGYTLNNQFMEIFRSVYDVQNARALYTVHIVRPFKPVTRRPEVEFVTDSIISGADAATFRRENIYARFNALLGANQRYITSSTANVISRGHLTPSADFPFSSDMRATFRYINVVPQFQSINTGNWRRIENWLRRRVERFPYAEVVTGVHDVLQLRDTNNNMVDMYLGENERNPIPKWMYKIIKDALGTFVFLTSNNIYDAPEEFSGTCVVVPCPEDIVFKKTLASGITVCCDPETFSL